MLNIVYGALGAAAVFLLLGIGMFAGYKLHARLAALEKAEKPEPETPEEAERRRLIEDQKASKQLMNYSVEMAYGMITARDFEGGDG